MPVLGACGDGAGSRGRGRGRSMESNVVIEIDLHDVSQCSVLAPGSVGGGNVRGSQCGFADAWTLSLLVMDRGLLG